MPTTAETKGEVSSGLINVTKQLQQQVSQINADDDALKITLETLLKSLAALVNAEEKNVVARDTYQKQKQSFLSDTKNDLKQIEQTTDGQRLNELSNKVSQLEAGLAATKVIEGASVLQQLATLQDEYRNMKKEFEAAAKASPRARGQMQALIDDADQRLKSYEQWQQDFTKQLEQQQKQHDEAVGEFQASLSHIKTALTKRLAALEKGQQEIKERQYIQERKQENLEQKQKDLEAKYQKLKSHIDPRYTLAEKLLKFRTYVLENAFITDELKYYVPPNGESKIGAGDYQPLCEWMHNELLDNKATTKVVLLEGEAGAGKSTLNRFMLRDLWQNEAWKSFKPGQVPPAAYVPLFIPLGSLHVEPQHLLGYLKHLPELATGLTDAEINVLKADYRVLLIADGYDELRNQQAINLYDTNCFAQQAPHLKLIIGCRSQRTQALNKDEVFAPQDSSGMPIPEQLKQRHVSPFTKTQIQAYIKNFVEKNKTSTSWEVADYERALTKLPELQTFLATPFMLLMSMSLLPRLTATTEIKHTTTGETKSDTTSTVTTTLSSLTRLTLYDAFMDQWLEREASKALQAGDSTSPKQLVDLYRQFCVKFAEGLKLASISSVQYPYGEEELFGDDMFTAKPKVEVDPKGPRGPWVELLFNDSNKMMARSRKGAPILMAPGNHHRFIHNSLLDYFLATALTERLRIIVTNKASEASIKMLNELLATQPTSDQLSWLLDRLQHDKKLEESVWYYLNQQTDNTTLSALATGLKHAQKEREDNALRSQGPLGIRLLEQLQLNQALREEIKILVSKVGSDQKQDETPSQTQLKEKDVQIEQLRTELARAKAQLKDQQDKAQEEIKGLTTRLGFFTGKERLAEEARKAAEAKKELEQKETPAFIKLVADGEQDKAEALLKTKPGLALCYSEIKDMGGRTFKRITAFQYAAWALDWHMWTMLLKYLPQEQAAQQYVELKTKGTEHGKMFNLQPLIDAYKTYGDNYSKWNGDQRSNHWVKAIGGQQRLLPVHVLNEYCRSDRSFDPCPAFKESTLPRSLPDWLSKGGMLVNDLGASWGMYRADGSPSWTKHDLHIYGMYQQEWAVIEQACRMDLDAVSAMSKCRTEQREILAATLRTKNVEEKPSFEQKEVVTFLKLVADGEQDKAEALLKSEPGLALCYSEVKDMGGRTFKRITAFQYAVWALDWHMWTMLLKYVPQEQAAQQYEELENKGTEYGKAFNLQPLIDAYKTYETYYENADKMIAWDNVEPKNRWCSVGGNQRVLPVHVLNEYCRSDRSFDPCPTFTESALPRGFPTEWLSKLGDGWTIVRTRGDLRMEMHTQLSSYWREARIDREAVSAMSKRRTEQREILASTFRTGQSLARVEHKRL